MSIQFPANPQLNATFDYDDKTYIWDGEKWTASAIGSFDEAYVNISGDTMTGDLTVPNLISEGDVTAGGDITADGNISGANGIFEGDVQTTSLNGGPLAGMRNQIINGGMQISQRGQSTAVPANTLTYVADRFIAFTPTAQTVTIQDDSSTPTGLHLNIPSGATLITSLELNTPGKNCQFRGTWTFSFLSTEAPTANATFEFRNSTFNSANKVIIASVACTPTGVTYGSFVQYACQVNMSSAVAAGSNTCLYIDIGLGAANTNATAFQFEPGSVATPLELRSIQTELALCQRYYFARPGNILATKYTDGNAFIIDMPFPVTMRIAPSIKTAATVNWASIDLTSTNTHALVASGAAVASNNPVYMQDITADAEL